jgi:hypothetical protein
MSPKGVLLLGFLLVFPVSARAQPPVAPEQKDARPPLTNDLPWVVVAKDKKGFVRVLDVVRVAQEAAADAPRHRGVPLH